MSKLNLRILSILLSLGLAACQSTPPEATPEPQVVIAPKEAAADVKPAPEPKPDPEQELYLQAIGSAKKDKHKLAIQYLNELIKLNPEFRQVHTSLGLALLQTNQQEQAKQAFKNAIKQDKSDAIAYNHLAIIQRQEGLFKPALENYNLAIKADPEYANAYLNLGILLDIYLQDLPKALEQYLMFQKLTDNKDERIEKWVLDIKRRIEAKSKKSKG